MPNTYARIYQIDPELDKNRLCFAGLEELKQQGVTQPDASVYRLVYGGEFPDGNLERIYQTLNIDHPKGYGGRSLSVSDIVELCGENSTFHFCDSVGFQPIQFDASKVHAEGMMKILYIEPLQVPEAREIRNNLETLQSMVSGLIEPVYIGDGVMAIGNEEAKLEQLPGNRRIDNGDILAGPFLICGDGGEDFCSLTEEQLQQYEQRFHQPEIFTPEEVEGTMFIGFQSF